MATRQDVVLQQRGAQGGLGGSQMGSVVRDGPQERIEGEKRAPRGEGGGFSIWHVQSTGLTRQP